MRSNSFKANTKNKTNVLEVGNTYGKKLPIKFDITMMNSLIGYVFKRSPQITRKTLNNLKSLFAIVDERQYENNDKLRARFEFLTKAIEARVDSGIESEAIMLNYCTDDNMNEENQDIIQNIGAYKKLNYEEIGFINRSVQDRLKYAYLSSVKGELYDIIERMELGNYRSYKEINDKLVSLCKKVIEKSRSINVVDQTDTFSLDPKMFDELVTNIVQKLKDPTSILRTGIQCLNEILVKGYHSKRVYYFMGLPGGFKSGILLKSAIDIMKYNKGIPAKKEGHRKTVLIVTMENTVEETVERLFNMTVSPEDIRDFDTDAIIKGLKQEGQMTIANKDDIDLVIKYYPNRSISTDDLYTIIDDLEDENREVIALILDYIKRIRPFEVAREEKEELKNISNELKTLAIARDIPIITAHQLNRGAATIVDSSLENSKTDVTKQIGRGNIGTAWEIMENADWVSIINIEQKRETNQYYLTFKRVKIRYKFDSELSYFNHPFVAENRVRLMDDLGYPEHLSEISLSSDLQGGELVMKKGKRTSSDRTMVDADSNDAVSVFNFKLRSLEKQIIPGAHLLEDEAV